MVYTKYCLPVTLSCLAKILLPVYNHDTRYTLHMPSEGKKRKEGKRRRKKKKLNVINEESFQLHEWFRYYVNISNRVANNDKLYISGSNNIVITSTMTFKRLWLLRMGMMIHHQTYQFVDNQSAKKHSNTVQYSTKFWLIQTLWDLQKTKILSWFDLCRKTPQYT